MPPGAAAGCQDACNFRAFRAALTAYIIAHAHSGLQHLVLVVGALSRMLSPRAGRRSLTPFNLPRGRGRHAAPDESGCAGLGPVHRGEDRVIRRGQARFSGRGRTGPVPNMPCGETGWLVRNPSTCAMTGPIFGDSMSSDAVGSQQYLHWVAAWSIGAVLTNQTKCCGAEALR